MKDLDATFYAVLEIWEELPRLVGSQYAALHPRLLETLDGIRSASPDAREERVFELLDCLEPFPAVRERIRAVRKTTERIRHHAEARGEVPFFDVEPTLYGRALDERRRPPKLVRTTDVTAPRRLPVGERGAITVGLLDAPADGVGTEVLELLFGRRVEVHLIAVSPGLEILEAKVRVLDVRFGDGEPPRAVFLVRGESEGKKHLCVDFHQAGELLRSVPISIEVGPPATSTGELVRSAASKLETGGLDIPPCDLLFRVAMAREDSVTRFHYTLSSPTGVGPYLRDFEGPAIESSAEAYREQLLTSFEEMRADSSAEPATQRTARAPRRLVGIGEKIFDELLPEEVQGRLERLDWSKVRTVQIASDEPWIPWELLRLRAPDPEDEAFWCEKCVLTRWLTGDHQPVHSLTVSRLVRIAAGGEPEGDDGSLFAFASEAGVLTKELRSATLGEVEKTLDLETPDLWHVEAPGSPSTDGRTVGIRLESGTLWPEDFDHRRRRRIAERRPLVFLNVAGGGQLDRGLTRLEGWAPLWVSQCGCGVFLAPIAGIDDRIGRRFCRVFYAALERGKTLGEAVREARSAAKAVNPADPTWAVYSVYGHPNARIAFAAARLEDVRR